MAEKEKGCIKTVHSAHASMIHQDFLMEEAIEEEMNQKAEN